MNICLNSRVELGSMAVIDDDDYEKIKGHTWHLRIVKNTRYAYTNTYENRRVKNLAMHTLIAGSSAGVVVDHIDGNGLNNRRSNLRIVTHKQNFLNTKLRCDSSSGYKGVSWSHGKWVARIGLGGKRIRLGVFDDKREAARAYNRAALEYFGEYARLNAVD